MFRYYITRLSDGVITGTNNRDLALKYAQDENYVAVDAVDGNFFLDYYQYPVEEEY